MIVCSRLHRQTADGGSLHHERPSRVASDEHVPLFFTHSVPGLFVSERGISNAATANSNERAVWSERHDVDAHARCRFRCGDSFIWPLHATCLAYLK